MASPAQAGRRRHQRQCAGRNGGPSGQQPQGLLPIPAQITGGEDLELGKRRQARLNTEANRRGETWSPLVVDGLVGARSLARARQLGIARWRDVPAGSA